MVDRSERPRWAILPTARSVEEKEEEEKEENSYRFIGF
jgi:hypothetical protein